MGWGNMMGWGGGPSWMWGGWVVMAVLWFLIIMGIVFLIRWIVSETRRGEARGETPMDILKKRYAHGEIDKAQYEQMKKDIM